ncbi:MAG: DUF2199 domain-containing protein [Streptosporangiales bacterium]|nr:DUF2199 domain-containing protein [Streptosporangiales bacterium]
MTPEDFPTASGGCRVCGCDLDPYDRHLQFQLPDALLSLPQAELLRRTAYENGMLEVQGYGSFVRCLLRVTMTQDSTVTFGVWLAVHQVEFDRAYEIWDRPGYAELELFGSLANAVPPWGQPLLGAAARAVVRDTDEPPWVVEGFTPLLDQVLTGIWPHSEVLAGLPK